MAKVFVGVLFLARGGESSGFSENMAKLWPKLGHIRKKILHFRSFRVSCKISLVPGTGTPQAQLLISNYL